MRHLGICSNYLFHSVCPHPILHPQKESPELLRKSRVYFVMVNVVRVWRLLRSRLQPSTYSRVSRWPWRPHQFPWQRQTTNRTYVYVSICIPLFVSRRFTWLTHHLSHLLTCLIWAVISHFEHTTEFSHGLSVSWQQFNIHGRQSMQSKLLNCCKAAKKPTEMHQSAIDYFVIKILIYSPTLTRQFPRIRRSTPRLFVYSSTAVWHF